MTLEPATYLALSKPRITAMVVLVAALSFLFGLSVAPTDSSPSADWVWPLSWLCAGTALLSAGASAVNMWMERDLDSRMERTRVRPLPAGRVAPATVMVFGLAAAAAGTVLLVRTVGALTALLGAATFLVYVAVYTPLKTRTEWATHVGTVPGALPVLMGYSAARGAVEAPGLVLFGILLIWQLPHFFAINWLYRDEYRRAGFRMLASADPSGRRLAIESVVFAAALLLVSLAPPLRAQTGITYELAALVLGGAFLAVVVRFARARSLATARHAVLASVVYLPAIFAALIVDRLLAGRLPLW